MKDKTAIQRIMDAYKHAKGLAMDNPEWDRACFSRYSRPAASILRCFGGDLDKAAAYIFLRSEDFNESKLSWTLDTIARHAWDGQGMPKGATNGLRNKSVDSDELDGQRTNRRTTQAREITSDVIRRIQQVSIYPKKLTDMAELEPDSRNDEE